MPHRRQIDPAIETKVLMQSARRCCLCFHERQNPNYFHVKNGQIAHLDKNPGNGSADNLAFLCMDHHTLYDSKTSQHKNYTIQEVKAARTRLYEEVGRYKPCEWMMVVEGAFSDFDKERTIAIVELLCKILNDPHVMITKVLRGSVVLRVSGSEAALGLLKILFTSGELKEMFGHRIRQIERTPAVEDLRGEKATYQLVEELGRGRAGVTYMASVHQILKPDIDLVVGQTVVVKLPNIDFGLAPHEKMRLYARVAELTGAEYSSLQKLKGLSCVATVLDWGAELITLASNVQVPAIFLVQEYVRGELLTEHFTSGYEGEGIESSDEFFKWALKLANGLLHIHQRQVIHGDIWPDNIVVRESSTEADPVYIDFGQAIFRDLAFDPTEAEGRNSAYIAPERSKSVGGDIYSLGGVLYFLATGRHPFEPIEDINVLKSTVVKNLNPRLYRGNCGIADIISRCLRYSRYGRTPHAHGLVEDIETFQRVRASNASPALPHEELQKALVTLEQQGNPLFVWITDLRARALIADLEDMAHGMYDLTGDHETLVSALTEFVSILSSGDSYLTMSTSAYWLPQNVGVNGRFLSMNKLAALNGATIRRVFVVTEAELENDQDLRTALNFHLDELDELRHAGVRTDQGDIEAGGYYACIERVDADLQASMVRQGMHFGLANKGSSQMVLYPIYREDRTLVSIQFRVGEDFGHLEQEFKIHLARAEPLEKYRERLRKGGTGEGAR